MKTLAFLLAVLTVVAAVPARADEATETRLRDALRQAIAQQRSLEDSSAQLQARVSDQDKLIAALKAQAEQRKPAAGPAVDQGAVERIAEEANRRITAQNEALAKAGETLEKWKAAYEQAATIAKAKEAERARLAQQMDGLTKKTEACVAKNEAMFKAAGEVLDHLKAISVADAIEAHEPFVGTKRVELQTLAQDDEDKLLDQRAGR